MASFALRCVLSFFARWDARRVRRTWMRRQRRYAGGVRFLDACRDLYEECSDDEDYQSDSDRGNNNEQV